MVACSDALFAQHEPLLRDLSSKMFHVSTRIGDGARTKLVNNLLAAINLVGAAEATALAQRLGLDASRTLDVIEQSSGQSLIGNERMRRAVAGDFSLVRAHMSLLAKDIKLAMEMAGEAGAFLVRWARWLPRRSHLLWLQEWRIWMMRKCWIFWLMA